MRTSTVYVLAGMTLALSCRGRDRAHAGAAGEPAEHVSSALAPDPSVIHYRYATAPDPDADTTSMIKQLEERAASPIGSPEDLGELAGLYVRRAQQDGNLDDYKRAEQMARRSLALRAFPNGAKLILAETANARHDFQQAIEIARDSLKNKANAGSFDVLASAYLALGELGDAATAAESAVSIAGTTSSYLMRALVLQAQGRDAEAAFDFTHAVAVETYGDPQEAARARTLWGRFLLRRGELDGAALVIDEALRIVPGFPLALGQSAELALRLGRLTEARAMFEQAFTASRQVRYMIDLTRAQELAGDAAGAASWRTQVERMVRTELATSGPGHQLELVEILVDRGAPGDLTEAVTLGLEEVARRPSADARFQLARAFWRSGARDAAGTQIRAALATGARDARLYELAARIEGGSRGVLYTQLAVELDPGGSGWRGLGMGK